MTFICQWILVYELWVGIGGYDDVDDYNPDATSNLCRLSIPLEVAAIFVFFMSMMPSLFDVMFESHIVLFCERYSDSSNKDDDDGTVQILKMTHSPWKRIFVWLFVCLAEFLIVVAVTIAGVKFM